MCIVMFTQKGIKQLEVSVDDTLDSELDLFPITPTSESWAEGDRVVYCALYALDLSKLTGSMEGSRR